MLLKHNSNFDTKRGRCSYTSILHLGNMDFEAVLSTANDLSGPWQKLYHYVAFISRMVLATNRMITTQAGQPKLKALLYWW